MATANSPRIAILVPAHDEEACIGETIAALRDELRPGDRLLVIADNCSDNTAELARQAGAEVVERKDCERRGKGFALSFGACELSKDPPDVVVVVDADCRVETGSLHELADLAVESDRPVQAVYLMHADSPRPGLSGISAFAFLVRNLVRPRGLKRLGMPCQLTGTGMAFPWLLFRDAPATGSFLVEDLLLGHELALRGHAPVLCEDVLVGSDLPREASASLKQRRRWEHGELSVLLKTAPRLLAAGVRRRDLGLVALGLDALVPPLALLVLLQGALIAAGGLLVVVGGSNLPLMLSTCGVVVVGTGIGAAWLAHGRQLIPVSAIPSIARYAFWKLPLYTSFVRRGAHTHWERTDRAR
jgi:cellulose synthase/poly-beta-1,6-N-acetylglucosamine synthase-like glycosyltransferase